MASLSEINAARIAREAHAGVVDRRGEAYIGHVSRVVGNLLHRWPDATEDEIVAAWLHDVIEDTDWDEAGLLAAGISPAAISIVKEVSRPQGMTYLGWIRDLADNGSISAVRVKLADNQDNSDPARIFEGGETMIRKRYAPAKALLEKRLEDVRS